MALRLDMDWLITSLLLSVRVAAATAFAPVFGPSQVPAVARVAISLAIGAFLAAAFPLQAVVTDSLAGLAVAAACEALIGLSFAFGLLAAYAATQVAGRALDVQIGFGAASILNPASQGLSPLLGSVFGMAMLMVFLAMDGHHLLLQALARSVVSYPPDGGGLPPLELVIKQSGLMFAFGLALAAPVMFALWLTDVSMAIFARSMAQLNVFVLSFAVKIFIGMVALAMSIGMTRTLFDGLFDATFRYWDTMAG